MTENTKIEVALAKIEGALTTEIKHLSHDVKNLSMKLDGYATLRDLDAACRRVESLEDSRSWLIKAIYGAWIAGGFTVIGGLVAYVKAISH